MREYGSAADFRAAVEAKLRERARQLGVPAYVLRRQAGLERLMPRLTALAPGRWALKGGFALETRLGRRARVSLDLDADHLRGALAARADLQQAAVADIGDHFAFAVTGAEELRAGGAGLAVRYRLESSIAGRPFEPLQVDVSVAAPDPWDAQPALRPGLLSALGLEPIEVWLVPLERQVAEKLHAYTRTYESGGTTRAKDLVDLLLIREHQRPDPRRAARRASACLPSARDPCRSRAAAGSAARACRRLSQGGGTGRGRVRAGGGPSAPRGVARSRPGGDAAVGNSSVLARERAQQRAT